MSKTLIHTIAAIIMVFVTSLAHAGFQFESGTFQHSDKPVELTTDYGVFEAKPTANGASAAARYIVDVGGLKLGAGARVGKTEWRAYDAQAFTEAYALTDAAKAIQAEVDNELMKESPDAEFIAASEDEIKGLNEQSAAITNQFGTDETAEGLSFTAMKPFGKLSVGTELFVTEDEVLKSARIEYSSKHGDNTFGVASNIGKDWVGVSATVEF